MLTFLLVAAGTQAQTTQGDILGSVSDSANAAVSGATVTVREINTGQQRTGLTNEAGLYDITNLSPGSYHVVVEAEGFRKFIWEKATLSSNQKLRIDARLEVGAVTESVQVTAAAPVIESETGRIADYVDYRSLRHVVQNGRGTYNWLILSAGAFYNGQGYSINGSRNAANGYNIDGVSTGNPSTGREYQSMRPDQEMVRELRIDSVNNNAEFGQAGTVSMTTLGGTNDFHGQGTWTFGNGVLNARNFFSSTRPGGYPINNWFGNVGGPVLIPKLYNGRNHTFFFFHHDGQERTQATPRVMNVPTVNMRRGDFTGLGVVRDPLTGQPFAGNVIPQGRLAAPASKFLDRFYPLPTVNSVQPAANWNQNLRDGDVRSDRAYSVRADHVIGKSNTLSGRYWFNRFDFHNLDGGLPPEILGYRFRLRQTYSANLSDTHVFSPSVVNEFRFGYIRFSDRLNAVVKGKEIVDLIGLSGFPAPLDGNEYGAPTVTIAGLQGISLTATTRNIDNGYDLRDNLTVIRNNHNLKAGVAVNRGQSSAYPITPSQQFGTYNFDGFATGQPFADYLLGIPRTASRAAAVSPYYGTGWQTALFLQDEWKVLRTLTLNFGLRFERFLPWTEKNNRLYNFDPATGAIVVPGGEARDQINPLFPTNVPVALAADTGFPRQSLIRTDPKNFAPRFGFAWRTPLSNLVVRGGYGLFYNFESRKAFAQMTSGPFVATETYDNAITGGQPLFAWPRAFPSTSARGLGTQNVNATSVNLYSSYVHQWNLTLEKQLGDYGARLSYIGSSGIQQPYRRNINQPIPSALGFDQNRRPYPVVRDVVFFDRGANNSYHALQAQVTRRLASGFLLDAHFTWSRNLTDSPETSLYGSTLENAFDRRREWGEDISNPRLRFVSAFIYELPAGKGRRLLAGAPPLAEAILGGWTVSGNLQANTGVWYTPFFTGRDISGTNITTGWPDRICDGNLPGDRRDVTRWFDVSCFAVPAANSGRFGNSGRAIIEGPGYWGLNAGLFKYIQLPGRDDFRVRIQAMTQNVFNHPKFGGVGGPDLNITSPTAGRFTATDAHGLNDISTNRVIELGIRLEF